MIRRFVLMFLRIGLPLTDYFSWGVSRKCEVVQ